MYLVHALKKDKFSSLLQPASFFFLGLESEKIYIFLNQRFFDSEPTPPSPRKHTCYYKKFLKKIYSKKKKNLKKKKNKKKLKKKILKKNL